MKCDRCGHRIPSGAAECPNCGAEIAQPERSQTAMPQTIEELQAFCASKNLPLEKMRFFIGQDYKQPRAFGIYKEADGTVVVYKNKENGSRAVRYQGPDEAYAVKEIYEKMKSEIALRNDRRRPSPAQKKIRRRRRWIAALIAVAILSIFTVVAIRTPDKGYYTYCDDYYYYDSDDWYLYSWLNDAWYPVYDVDDILEDNYGDYWVGLGYYDEFGISDFADSEYYSESSDYSGDSDSDWSSDWDSWDFGDTDWGSDW